MMLSKTPETQLCLAADNILFFLKLDILYLLFYITIPIIPKVKRFVHSWVIHLWITGVLVMLF